MMHDHDSEALGGSTISTSAVTPVLRSLVQYLVSKSSKYSNKLVLGLRRRIGPARRSFDRSENRLLLLSSIHLVRHNSIHHQMDGKGNLARYALRSACNSDLPPGVLLSRIIQLSHWHPRTIRNSQFT